MNSKALFIKQVGGHMDSLCELLGCVTGEPPSADGMARGTVSTRMLAGTTALMKLNAWEELLNGYHDLLESYREGGHPWDERVAGMTSELVEREERLVTAYEADTKMDIAGTVSTTELTALITEVDALREECGSVPSPADVAGADSPAAVAQGESEPAPAANSETTSPAPTNSVAGHPAAEGQRGQAREDFDLDAEAEAALSALDGAMAETQAQVADETEARVADETEARAADETEVDLTALGAQPADDVPLAGVIESLRNVATRLLGRIDSAAWRERQWQSNDVRGIRADLGTLAFCAGSIERAVLTCAGDEAGPAWCDLSTLSSALDDFVRELARDSLRELEIQVDDDGTAMDAALLAPAESIVQWMIADIFDRSEARRVRISINVSERYGAMCWRLSDDGDNRVSDSKLDREDQPAFYPRLRRVIRMLARHHGALWVEPKDSRSRFEFTLPVTHEPEPLLLWGENGDTFAVRASQICQVVPGSSGTNASDTYGDYLDLDGSRVPLVRLDHLFGGAPSDGEMMAVVGTVEKRVAFYVPDCGERATGRPDNDSVSIWKGPPQHVIRIGDRRVPLLDADDILAAYLVVTGSVPAGENPGGVARDDLDGVQSQAHAPGPGAAASPGVGLTAAHTMRGTSPVDLLVVEQSDGLRGEFEDILARDNVRAAFAATVDEAMAIIRQRSPRLVISEFRMPSMAAKHLVDRLRDEGPDLPVLVTTSQSGKTADLLVEKLGVSGYLSKPLKRADVVETIGAFLEQDVGAS